MTLQHFHGSNLCPQLRYVFWWDAPDEFTCSPPATESLSQVHSLYHALWALILSGQQTRASLDYKWQGKKRSPSIASLHTILRFPALGDIAPLIPDNFCWFTFPSLPLVPRSKLPAHLCAIKFLQAIFFGLFTTSFSFNNWIWPYDWNLTNCNMKQDSTGQTSNYSTPYSCLQQHQIPKTMAVKSL